MKYLFLLFSFSFYGQVLHHEMISSQGFTKVLPNGLIVKQTIGQQSQTGNSSSNYIVMQGFQQSDWSKYITTSELAELAGIKVTTFPNPFIETINFQFSEPITDVITVSVFDVLGRMVFEQKKQSNNAILSIDLSRFPTSEYLVQLKATNLIYYTKILKK